MDTDTQFKIDARVQALLVVSKPPGASEDIDTACHALAVDLCDMGGCKIVDNAVAILHGVVDSWPRKPSEATILKVAVWVTRQDPNATMRRAEALANLRNTDPLVRRIEDAIAGRLTSEEWPWVSLKGLTRSLVPGGITVIVGNPGTSKSFLLLQSVLFWHEHGVRTAILELEEGPGFWQQRALALMAGKGCLTDPDWVARYPEETRDTVLRHINGLQTLAESMTCAEAEGMTLDQVGTWVEKMAASGHRIICIDPITAASSGSEKTWLAADRFMLRAKAAISKYGCSLVITSHPPKGNAFTNNKPSLDNIAGGAAFGRFSSTVLWLDGNAEINQENLMDDDGRIYTSEVNRRILILKSREGRGAGMSMGMFFDGHTLRLEQKGIIVNSTAHANRAAKSVKSAGLAKPRASAVKMTDDPSDTEDRFK